MKTALPILLGLSLFPTFLTAEDDITKVNATTKAFWSYKPLRRPSVPEVKDPAWSRSPIDAFLADRLEANGLKPNGPASRRSARQRVSGVRGHSKGALTHGPPLGATETRISLFL